MHIIPSFGQGAELKKLTERGSSRHPEAHHRQNPLSPALSSWPPSRRRHHRHNQPPPPPGSSSNPPLLHCSHDSMRDGRRYLLCCQPLRGLQLPTSFNPFSAAAHTASSVTAHPDSSSYSLIMSSLSPRVYSDSCCSVTATHVPEFCLTVAVQLGF